MKPKWSFHIAAVAIIAFSISYFLLTYYRTLNYADEGYLLYNSQKVAAGYVPHLDFYDDYGPASYWVGGALFKIFGTKLIIIRTFLVALKTVMALLILLIARKLLPTGFAIIATFLFVLNWGDPHLPASNILYAGHFSHFLALVGIMLMILYVERENRWWLVGVGVCLGISLLFKFQAAVFDFIGFSLFLSLKELTGGSSNLVAADPETSDGGPGMLIMRLVKCLGVISVALFYLALFLRYRLDIYYFFIFLFPFFLLLGHMLVAEIGNLGANISGSQYQGNLSKCYGEILILMIVPILFLILELSYYYVLNGVDELIYDTFELPLTMNFYLPMTDPHLNAGIVAMAALLILFIFSAGHLLKNANTTVRTASRGLLPALIILLPIMCFVRGISFQVWHMRSVHILPPITLLLASWFFLIMWRKEGQNGKVSRESLVLGLVFIFSCQAFIMSFPRTDETHIQFNGTILFILMAFVLHRVYLEWAAPRSRWEKVYGAMLTAVCVAALCIPYLWSMKIFRVFTPGIPETYRKQHSADPLVSGIESGLIHAYPKAVFDFPRSRGLSIPIWPTPPVHPVVMKDLPEVVHYIRSNTKRDEPIFVMSELQVIYFLAERESIMQKENYFTFLAAVNLIDPTDTVRLTDEQLLERLIEARPRFIIQENTGGHTKNIIAVWPKASTFVTQNYKVAAIFGSYIILEPRPGSRAKAHSAQL